MSQIEVPGWVVQAAMDAYAKVNADNGEPVEYFPEAMISALTAALGAWVVPAGFTNSEEMRELLAGRGGWVSGIELDGDTHTLYTLRQEKPE